MGVLGLAPFLLKKCPEVFKSLPHRLKGLRGKTLVIDGTLITQRLHFAPMPHPYRHVLGWYRIIQEMNENGVRAICVFDGKERSSAKQGEVQRRRELRRITALRGQLEAQRLQRLCDLASHVKAWRALDADAQQATSNQLRELVQASSFSGQELPSYVAGDLAFESLAGYWATSYPPKEDAGGMDNSIIEPDGLTDDMEDGHDGFEGTELSEMLPEASTIRAETETETLSDLHAPGIDTDDSGAISHKKLPGATIEVAGTLLEHLSLEDTDPARMDESYELVDELSQDEIPQDDMPLGVPTEQVPDAHVPPALVTSYLEYRTSIDKLGLLSANTPTVHPAPTTAEGGTEARADYVMSKTQHQLTVDEGKFWTQLVESTSPDTVEASVLALAKKSSLVTTSYERRVHPPTHATYEESMEILRAMSVPCLESSGPFEAEALAASLVLHGLADYVASEDTDVIVYGAPLIRNLTKRESPLVLVRGEDVRAMLELDQQRFIDFALLLGTDFSQRIKNVGPQRALKFIREHGTIERVLEHEPQYSPRMPTAVYLEQVAEARLTFETLPPTPDAELLQPSEFDEELAHNVLRKYGLAREIPSTDWYFTDALAGNYFQDNPSASLASSMLSGAPLNSTL